jgi:hypothetical protein
LRRTRRGPFLRKRPALCSRKVTTTKLFPTNAEPAALMNHDRAKPGLPSSLSE